MEITEVRVKLTADSDDRLQAFCSITFDNCFVVRDLKIIEGSSGPFVAMPSRKLTSHCPRCGCKNHLRAVYCNQCSGKLNPERAVREQDGRVKLYADIAHPINSPCREMIQQRVIAEYQQERELAKDPGYVPRFNDDFDDDFCDSPTPIGQTSARPEGPDHEHTTDLRQVEPATAEPRPPHKTHSHRSETEPRPANRADVERHNGGFGAGILDD